MNGFGKGTVFSRAVKSQLGMRALASEVSLCLSRREFILAAGNVLTSCTNNDAVTLNGALLARRQRSVPVENK